jgi:hypothetical protein
MNTEITPTYYRYRLGTLTGIIPVLSECATRQELWAQIAKMKDTEAVEFYHVGPDGVKFGISIKASAILMIDDAYGTAPVPTLSPAAPQGRRIVNPNRIVIGQQTESPAPATTSKAKKK